MLTLTTVRHGKALVPLLPEDSLSEKDTLTLSSLQQNAQNLSGMQDFSFQKMEVNTHRAEN